MSVTLETYQEALDVFLRSAESLGGDVVSVMLFGSMVRGEVRPGSSDIMDAFIFLDPEILQNRERYLKALETMADVSSELVHTGIPCHPFFYWTDAESWSAMFLPPCLSDVASKIVLGKDIRGSLKTSAASRWFASKAFFEGRRRGFQRASYLVKEELSEEDCRIIAYALSEARKYVAMVACMAMDIWVSEPDLLNELEKALPNLDTSILHRLSALRDQPGVLADGEALRQLLRELFILVESINDELTLNFRGAREV